MFNICTIVMIASIIVCPTQMDRVLDAIRFIESSNRTNPPDGDNGKAIGPYQIHKKYWQDGCAILKVKWPYADARNLVKARVVVRAYIEHYGKGMGIDSMIRIHNGGPNGWRKKSTLVYLKKVTAAMN